MKIKEIFRSIDGEVNGFHQGRISTFVRLSGCNLTCSYCDTKYALDPDSGIDLPVGKVFQEIKSFGCKKVTITGGEPLLQKTELYILIDVLLGHNYKISVETNGTQEISPLYLVCKDISWIIDYKLDYKDKMIESNYAVLTQKDWVKFVVSENQIQEAIREKKHLMKLGCKANFAISLIFNDSLQKGGIQELLDILAKEKEFDFVVNVQLHKLLNLK